MTQTANLEKIDRDKVINNADLLALIERDSTLKRIGSTGRRGAEYAGPCPKCGGRDRLHVLPNDSPPHWFCRKCTGEPETDGFKNAIDYGMIIHGLDFVDACNLATGGTPPTLATRPQPVAPARPSPKGYKLDPPPAAWQDRGRAFVEYAESNLWQDPAALAYLHNRGLRDDIIKAARLGWNPKEIKDRPDRWGMKDTAFIWLPAGLVIPWFIGGDLWRVEIRQPTGDKIGPKGYQQGLYNADSLGPDRPAVLVEGVIDALTIAQAAADLVTPVATGATGHARRPRWLARLAQCPLVLVAFDNEPDKGQKAADYWLKVLPNAKRWRPFWGDPNQMAQDGADIRAWLLAGLGQQLPVKVITWPAALPLATIEGQARPLDNGKVEAWYYSAQELADCLEFTRFARELAAGGEKQQQTYNESTTAQAPLWG